MSVTLRRLAAITVPVLLAGSLSSCAQLGVGGPPTDASEDEFCGAYNGFIEDLLGSATSGEEPEAGEVYTSLQDQAGELEEVGTPEGISDDAREGFEIYLDTVNSINEDDFTEAYESGDGGDSPEDLGADELSDEDEDKVEAFTDYATETCGNPLEDQLGDLAP